MNHLHQLLLVCTLLVAAGASVWLAILAIRWAKKGGAVGSMLAAAAFPFPEQPPPQQQAEDANRLKKDAGFGDPE
jgi:hypothetical protein